jgi:hypothetical protein
MTPLTKIENGILGGDWTLVCEGFNKITGKNLTPPVVVVPEEVFDPNKASKKELYEFIKNKYNSSIVAMKSFSIDELREMIVIFGAEENEEIEVVAPKPQSPKKSKAPIDPNKTGFLPDGRFFQPTPLYGNKKMIPVDASPLRLVEDPSLKKVIEPDDFEHNARPAPKMIDAVCVRCKTKYKTLLGLAVTDEKDSDFRGNCPKCQESVGRK